MQTNVHESRKEISDMVLYGDILFVRLREGSIRGVDMKRYLNIPRDGVLLMTPQELYDSGAAVFCMLWDGDGKLLHEEITSNKNGIYIRYGSRAHKALHSLYHESMMAECCSLWY